MHPNAINQKKALTKAVVYLFKRLTNIFKLKKKFKAFPCCSNYKRHQTNKTNEKRI